VQRQRRRLPQRGDLAESATVTYVLDPESRDVDITMKRIVIAVLGLAAAALLPATGCYNYASVPFDGLHPGMEVRAQLTGAGVDRIRRTPGQGTFARLELTGQIVDVVPDTIVLGVPLSTFGGTDEAGQATDLIRPVALPRIDVTITQERQLDRRKTFVAVAMGSFLTAYAVYRLRGGGSMTPTTVVTSPPENRVPVSVRFP
jgi:hypothetical protein